MDRLPYLVPWVRVLLLIRSITATPWGHEAWPVVKPLLRRAFKMRRQIARDGWWDCQRLRAALAAVLVKAHAPELKLMHELLDSWAGLELIVVGNGAPELRPPDHCRRWP